MSLAVIDASVLAAFYAADDSRHYAVAARLAGGDVLFAPAHMDTEVTSALRSMARRSSVLGDAVPAALHHLAEFPIRRMPLPSLLQRIWELQANVTPYDAAYVALAERPGGPLVTVDGKLAAANGPRCLFDLIT